MTNIINTMITCGELMERIIVFGANLSTGSMDGLSLSKRLKMMLNVAEVNMYKPLYKL